MGRVNGVPSRYRYKLGDTVRARGERTRRTGPRIVRPIVVLGYAGLFVWQFVLGMAVGREAGFMVYGPLALFPCFIAGAPWFFVLYGFLEWVQPPGPLPDLDLTVLSGHTLLYHAIVLASFAINVALIFWLTRWYERMGGGVSWSARARE